MPGASPPPAADRPPPLPAPAAGRGRPVGAGRIRDELPVARREAREEGDAPGGWLGRRVGGRARGLFEGRAGPQAVAAARLPAGPAAPRGADRDPDPVCTHWGGAVERA